MTQLQFAPRHAMPPFLCHEVVRPEPMIVVYQAVNSINGKRYIGVTKNGMLKRSSQHFTKARLGHGYKFHAAIRKHGEEAFEFSLIRVCKTYAEALAHEIVEIARTCPEYNITTGGEGVTGLKMSERTRRIVSEANKGHKRWLGRKHSAETIEKMRILKTGVPNIKARGKKRSPEVLAKFREIKLANPSKYWLGKRRSQETIDKIIATKTGKTAHPNALAALERHRLVALELSAKNRRKNIICIDDGRVFSQAQEVADYYGVSIRTVRRSIQGLHTRGLKFTYLDVTE